jgi:hypothetical protein
MALGGGNEPTGEDDAASFAHALDSLKRHGSALLVLGNVPDEMYARASAQMLGDQNADPPRRRLLALADGNEQQIRERLADTGSQSPEWTRVVVYSTASRTAAVDGTDEATGTAPGGPLGMLQSRAEVVDGTITDLGVAVSTVIDEFDRAADGLEAAELRLAFDLLPVLLAEHDIESVFRFTHVLTHHIRDVDGMGHFWLPKSMSSDTARTLAPLFDATIELRLDGGALKQRWHFRDLDMTSDWLPVNQ